MYIKNIIGMNYLHAVKAESVLFCTSPYLGLSACEHYAHAKLSDCSFTSSDNLQRSVISSEGVNYNSYSQFKDVLKRRTYV